MRSIVKLVEQFCDMKFAVWGPVECAGCVEARIHALIDVKIYDVTVCSLLMIGIQPKLILLKYTRQYAIVD